LRLKILYFASAREIAERRMELLSFDGEMTVGELATRLREIHPRLKALEKATRYSVNLEIVDEDEVLHEGDEVAVLPAVTGG